MAAPKVEDVCQSFWMRVNDGAECDRCSRRREMMCSVRVRLPEIVSLEEVQISEAKAKLYIVEFEQCPRAESTREHALLASIRFDPA